MNNYSSIHNLSLKKEESVLITSYPQTYTLRTNLYYLPEHLRTVLNDVVQMGKRVFISTCRTLFEITCMLELLKLKEKYPTIKLFFICAEKPDTKSLAWKEFSDFTHFTDIQNQLDGSFYYSDNTSSNCNNKFCDWIIDRVSLIIGVFNLHQVNVSHTIQLAHLLNCPIINVYDARLRQDAIGCTIPYEHLYIIKDVELQKSISLCYSYYYGNIIRGTIFSDQRYINLHNRKVKIYTQLSNNISDISDIKRLADELNTVNQKLIRLIAQVSHKIGCSTSKEQILEVANKRIKKYEN